MSNNNYYNNGRFKKNHSQREYSKSFLQSYRRVSSTPLTEATNVGEISSSAQNNINPAEYAPNLQPTEIQQPQMRYINQTERNYDPFNPTVEQISPYYYFMQPPSYYPVPRLQNPHLSQIPPNNDNSAPAMMDCEELEQMLLSQSAGVAAPVPQAVQPQQPSHSKEMLENALKALILNGGNNSFQAQEEDNDAAEDQQQEEYILAKELNQASPPLAATSAQEEGQQGRESPTVITIVKKRRRPGNKKKAKKNITFDESRPAYSEQLTQQISEVHLSKETLVKIEKSIKKLFHELQPTKSEKEKKAHTLNKVRSLLKKRWKDCELHMFGSSANELCIKGSSDIDLCLIIPDKQSQKELAATSQNGKAKKPASQEEAEGSEDEEEANAVAAAEEEVPEDAETEEERRLRIKKKKQVGQLAAFLRKHHLRQIKSIATARVPIVKFVDVDSGLNVDICINNVLAIYNTHLLKDYSKIDSRFTQLCFIIKYWAKLRDVNEPYHGTLSSYAYVIMILHYLQKVNAIPVLQDLSLFSGQQVEPVSVNGLDAQTYDCTYFRDAEKISAVYADSLNKTESVAALLLGFFKYYACEFNTNEHVISIRFHPSKTIFKSEKGWADDQTTERNFLCIEDPFETKFNIGRSVTQEGLRDLKAEFMRAFVLLCKNSDLQTEVCARVKY